MGRITSSVGLISGIDTGSIISELISLDAQPVTQLQSQISAGTTQQAAYTDLATQLGTIKTIGDSLTLPTTFAAATATSSDPTVLTATAANGAAVGSFQFQVARLVTTQQAVSTGFTDASSAPVGAGTLTIDLGGGDLATQTNLADLNGGKGVDRATFRITDKSGSSQNIDISNAVTLDDVAKQINNATNISVKATIGSNGLQLTDLTGLSTGSLSVRDLGTDTTAANLGIASSSTTGTINATNVNTLGTGTALSSLNDGRGVFTASNGGADFRIAAANGNSFDVNVSSAKTVGDVLNAINTASGGSIKADIAPGSSGIRLTDQTGGGGAIVVANLNSSTAAADLGISGATTNNVLNGTSLISGVDSALVSSLNGGKGLALGQIAITDRSGNSQTIDLSGAKSVSDILNAINSQVDSGTGTHNINVTASLNAAGNGIALTDNTGGSGNLVVADSSGTTAAALGLAGSYNDTVTTVNGSNLHRQYVTSNTLLSNYNGGKGVALGKIQITNSTGQVTNVDLSTTTATKIGDVLAAINHANAGVTASINANGNGIQLTDTAGGPTTLTVANNGSTTASDLNIVGTATNGVIDGAEEKTITVTATDTLNTVATKINQLGFGVTASVINDGSSNAPARLSLNATNSGLDGRFVFDAGTTKLATTNLVQAQDAAVFIGGQGGSNPLLITSSSNQITNVIKGVTVNLLGTSTKPVTLNITQDSSGIQKQLQSLVDTYNTISTKLATYEKFDPATNTKGPLLGDGTAQAIEEDLANIVNGAVKGAGKYNILAQLGITLGDNNQLSFDSSKFAAAYATDSTSVKNLFTQTTTGFGSLISKTINQLTDPVNGIITVESQTITTRNQGYQDQITSLNTLLDQKKTRLQTQFANMESVLAGLQSQQTALASLSSIASTATSAATTASRATTTSTSSS